MAGTKILNLEQQQAINHNTGPLMIIAGAGTGKTTVITERIKHLILERKVQPSSILALTFTEKASREMEERIDVIMPYGYTELWIATFHAFCERLLRDEAIQIGLDPSFHLMTEAEAVLFLRKNLFELNLEYFRPLSNPYKFLQGLITHFSRLQDDDLQPSEYLKFAKNLADTNEDKQKTLELAEAFAKYQQLKIKHSVMDFADLISNTLRLLRTRPNILREYQNKFAYILVDEFQDTNFAQNELAILLAGQKQNITVVGDDDQAIYRFRGAAVANMIQFRQHFPQTKIITLTHNYRSAKQILDASYALIQNNNPDRLEVQEKVNKKLIAMRHSAEGVIDFIFTKRADNEAQEVAQKIKELVKKEKIEYKEIAILVRANDYSRPFVRALEREGIPYQFLGPGQLFHQEEIKDLIAYLKVLTNFEDSSSLYRVITNSLWDIPPRDIAAILNFAKKTNLSLFEALEKLSDSFLPPETTKKSEAIVTMIKRHLKYVPKVTAGQILYYYVSDSGLLEELIKQKSQLSEKRAQNIAKFFEKLKEFESEHTDASVFAVNEWIDLAMQMGESPLASNIDWSENNAVNILTIHASKGLEFPCVFLVNLVTQRFPTRERREQIPLPKELVKEQVSENDYHLQEERRLFYVGMTRAKDFLFLTAANFYGEGKRERKISPFVYEALSEETVKKIITKNGEQVTRQLSFLDLLPYKKDGERTPEPVKQKTPLTYLSYSQIQTFDTCPLHYKLKYLLKIPTPQTAPLSFGTSIHLVLREYYQKLMRRENADSQFLEELLNKYWIQKGYESKYHAQKSFTKAKKILLDYTKENLTKPLAVEIPFQFWLKNLKIGGRIDRVDEDNGKLAIIDYKTGNNIPSENKLKNDLQLTFYALAATEVKDALFAKKASDVTLSLHYVEPNIKLTTTRTSEQLVKAKELILQKAEEIATSDFTCSNSLFCKNCEYQILCQTSSD